MADEPGRYAAGALVFGASASVLVVEVVALRLLAPYLGLTLETSTVVIALALGAIALGSWWGGRLADVVPPGRALGPLLALSGLVVALTPVLVRTVGALGRPALLVVVAGATIVVPGVLLAAVTPLVTKVRLTSLTQTGTVVGRLSGIGTAGAIAGTVVTGFVLISRVPVSAILVGLGVVLVLAAVVVGRVARGWRAAAAPALLVVVGGLGTVVAPGGCDVETIYHCARVRTDPDRPSGRVLVLDGLDHSYVDLTDPTYLAFGYTRAVAAVVDAAFPPGEPLRAYHLGGGGLTVPRYLAAVRPGSTSVVSEIDPGVVALDRGPLAAPAPGVEVRVEDGRLGLRRLADASQQLVVGDAFGGVSVSWHLTTREAVTEVARVLDDQGIYVLNLIDFGSLAFARAEVATLRDRFASVTLVAEPDTLARRGGGNLVVVASDAPVDTTRLAAGLAGRGLTWRPVTGPDLQTWAGPAEVLTDDHAPVDQLLTPAAAR